MFNSLCHFHIKEQKVSSYSSEGIFAAISQFMKIILFLMDVKIHLATDDLKKVRVQHSSRYVTMLLATINIVIFILNPPPSLRCILFSKNFSDQKTYTSKFGQERPTSSRPFWGPPIARFLKEFRYHQLRHNICYNKLCRNSHWLQPS